MVTTKVPDISSSPAWLADGRARAGVVIFGGVLALSSSQSLDLAKIIYLVGVSLALIGSLLAIWRTRSTEAVTIMRSWIVASAVFAVLIGISLPVAIVRETPLTSWVRDAATFGLLAAAPVLAIDLATSSSRRFLTGMLLVAGGLGAVSWSLEWLNRRDILELPLARLVYPSGQLAIMLYLFALSVAIVGSRKAPYWIGTAGLVLGLLLVTGTRSILVILIGPLVLLIVAGRRRLLPAIAWVSVHALLAATFLVAFVGLLSPPDTPGLSDPPPSVGPTTPSPQASGQPTTIAPSPAGGSEPAAAPVTSTPAAPGVSPATAPSPRPGVIGDRFGTILAIASDLTSDASFRERATQYEVAWRLALSSPLLGVGPGHPIEWIDSSGRARADFTADTPLVYLAKFGILGLVVLGMYIAAYVGLVRRLLRSDGRSAVALTLVGFAAVSLALLPLQFQPDDKGMAFALVLILALALNKLASSDAEQGGSMRAP